MTNQAQTQYLLVREGPYMESDLISGKFCLNQHEENTLGRGEGANFVIIHEWISRLHCKFIWDANQWYIKDVGSFNGTYLNSAKLTPNVFYKLNIGDTIGFGIDYSTFAERSTIHNNPQFFVYRFTTNLIWSYTNNEINALCNNISLVAIKQ